MDVAGLVASARDWRWSSAAPGLPGGPALHSGPLSRPPDWLSNVDTPQTEAEVEALRERVRRRRPYGAPAWMTTAAARLGLEASLRPLGRPRKAVPTQPALFEPVP